MFQLGLLSFLISLFVYLELHNTSALVLQDVRPTGTGGNGEGLSKRDHRLVLVPHSSETFQYRGMDASVLVHGDFTVHMPGDIENILSMEKFDGMLKSIDCTGHGMSLQFNDDVTFAYAQQVWDWVNGEDNRTFVMVVGTGDCGWNTHRQPFVVSGIAYDEAQNIARLRADARDWQSVVHTYDLQIGNVPMPNSTVKTRDLSEDVSLDLSSSFPFNIKVGLGDLSAQAECTDCGTSGSIDFELKMSTKLLKPTGASIKMSPRGVSAQADIKWTGNAAQTKGKSFKKTVASIPLDPISIPGGIVDIGPTLDVDVGFEILSLLGSVSISSEATVTLPDAATVEIDLLEPSNTKFSGWSAMVDASPLEVEAKLSGGVQIFAQPSLKLVAKALGSGYQIGLGLKMPYIDAKLDLIESPTGACEEHGSAVKISSNIGAQLKIEASRVKDQESPPVDFRLGTVAVPLAEKCFGFGPLVGGDANSSSEARPTANHKTSPLL